MRYLNISQTLLFSLLLVFNSCQQDSKEKLPDVDFKRTGNSVVVRLESDADRLNTILTTTQYGRIPSDLAHLNLMTYNDNYELVPFLVKEQPIVKDLPNGAVSYTFEIFDEAVWDDGKPVTGKDYLFTLKTILNPKVECSIAPYVEEIKDVQIDAKNPKRFTVVLSPKTIYSLDFATNSFSVLPEHILDPKGLMKSIPLADLINPAKAEALAKNPNIIQFGELFNSPAYSNDPKYLVGCGPYRIESWTSGQKIVTKKKKDWWGEPLVKKYPELASYPDEIIFKVIIDPAATLAALKNEEIDVTNRITPEDFEAIKKNKRVSDTYEFYTPATTSYFSMPINMRNPKLADKRVRRALAHVVNVDEIINELYLGFGERVTSPVPLASPDYNKDLKPIAFDIDKAKQLLAEAGWKDSNKNGVVDKVINGKNTELSLTYLYTAGKETSEQMALLFQDNAKKAGIDIKVQAMEGREILAHWSALDFELLSAGRGNPTLSWNPEQNWRTDEDNRSGFGNAQTDALIDQIPVTFDVNKRRAMYKRLQAIIYDEQPEIFLFAPKECIAIHKRFATKPVSTSPGYNPSDFKLKN